MRVSWIGSYAFLKKEKNVSFFFFFFTQQVSASAWELMWKPNKDNEMIKNFIIT